MGYSRRVTSNGISMDWNGGQRTVGVTIEWEGVELVEWQAVCDAHLPPEAPPVNPYQDDVERGWEMR